MPTNTAITSSIVAGTVPPDRMCVKTGQDVVNLVQDFASIQSQDSEAPAGPDNSIAEQALNTANTALGAVQELQAAQKEVRSSGIITVPTGDSNYTYGFTPAMPSTDYDISVAIYAAALGFVSNTQLYNWRVLESSLSVNGFTLIFDNLPANSKISIRVVER